MLDIFYKVCAYCIVFGGTASIAVTLLSVMIGSSVASLMAIPVGLEKLFPNPPVVLPEPKPETDAFEDWLALNEDPIDVDITGITDYVDEVIHQSELMLDEIDENLKL